MFITRLVKQAMRRLKQGGIPTYAPELVRILPHDPEAFTQGLAFSNGRLYESTGKIGHSGLRCIDPDDGRILKLVSFDEPEVWAEGIAVFGQLLVQLTWKHRKARIYSMPGLDPSGEHHYEGEGWGLAVQLDKFVMSNGSDRLVFRDARFNPIGTLHVTMNGRPVQYLNDIEWVGSCIYANVLYNDAVLCIDARSGKVLAIYDCSNLVSLVQPSDPEQVLNGIAYNLLTETFFLTGKYWPKLFEVRLP